MSNRRDKADELEMKRMSYNNTSSKQKNSMSRIKGDFYVPEEPDF